jgi:hypothetical protein
LKRYPEVAALAMMMGFETSPKVGSVLVSAPATLGLRK